MLSLSWIIFNVVLCVALIASTAIGVWMTTDDADMRGMGVLWIVGTFVICGALLVANNFPFDMAYHSYRPVSGTVASVGSRLVDTGSNSTETKYVVTFKGSSQAYACLDTRCALVKPGDHLQLMCIRTWQYASVPGYDCNYDQ